MEPGASACEQNGVGEENAASAADIVSGDESDSGEDESEGDPDQSGGEDEESGSDEEHSEGGFEQGEGPDEKC